MAAAGRARNTRSQGTSDIKVVRMTSLPDHTRRRFNGVDEKNNSDRYVRQCRVGAESSDHTGRQVVDDSPPTLTKIVRAKSRQVPARSVMVVLHVR